KERRSVLASGQNLWRNAIRQPSSRNGHLWSRYSAGSVVRHRLDRRRGVLLHLSEPPAQAPVRHRGSPVFLALVEREGSGPPQGSADVFRMWLDPRIEVRSDLQIRSPVDIRPRGIHRPAFRELSASRKQGTEL